jgi:hypothetical protein
VNPLGSSNLFTILTLIAAPAVLTNASSVLALNTANRFGRVIDRSRQVAAEIEKGGDDETTALWHRQLQRLTQRAALLIRAQTAIYGALGLFVAGALLSVAGAALSIGHPTAYQIAALVSFGVGSLAAASLLYGCLLIVTETRMALVGLNDEAALIDARLKRKAT